MTELSFLLDLIINHRLQKVTKDAIMARFKFVESCMAMPHAYLPKEAKISNPTGQAASTVAALARHAEIPVLPEAVNVAQTAATAAAMASRQQAIAQAISGKPEPGRTSPRKF